MRAESMSGPIGIRAVVAVVTLTLGGCGFYSQQYGLAPQDPSLQVRPVGLTPPERSTKLLNPREAAAAQAELQTAADQQAAQAQALQAQAGAGEEHETH
jgi:hypothetical protein